MVGVIAECGGHFDVVGALGHIVRRGAGRRASRGGSLGVGDEPRLSASERERGTADATAIELAIVAPNVVSRDYPLRAD